MIVTVILAGTIADLKIGWAHILLMLLFFAFLGLADGDIDLADRLLQPCLVQYPRGALFLFYAGRIHEIKGEIDEVRQVLFPLLLFLHEFYGTTAKTCQNCLLC